MNMKERLTLRNVVIWGAALLGIVFFFLTFAIDGTIVNFEQDSLLVNHRMTYVFHNILWDGTNVDFYHDGVYESSIGTRSGAQFALPIIGAILLIVSCLGAVVVSFLVKNKKIYTISLIAAGVLAITGSIFIFFCKETMIRNFLFQEGVPLSDINQHYEEYKAMLNGQYESNALAYVIGVIGIVAGCAFGVSPFLPEKKLLK